MSADKLSEKGDECFRQTTNSINLKEKFSDSCEDETCKKSENGPEIISNSNGNQNPAIADEMNQEIYLPDTCEEWVTQVLNSIDYPETIFETFEHEAISKNEPEILSNSNGNQITAIADEVDREIYLPDTCEEWISQVLNSIDHSETIFETFNHERNSETESESLLSFSEYKNSAIAGETDQEIYPTDTCVEWNSEVLNSIDYSETIFETFEHEGISKNDPEFLSNSNGNQITEIADEVDQEIYPQDTCEKWISQVLNSIDYPETIFETFEHEGISKNDPEFLSNSNRNQITEIADEVDQEIHRQDTCEELVTQVFNSIDHSETIFETFKHDGNGENNPEILSIWNGNQITAIADKMDQEIFPQDTCEEWISQVLNSIDYPETIFETFEHEGIGKNDPEFLSNSNGNQITAIADKMDQEIYPQDTCEEWISQVLNSIDYPETIFETFEHEGISKNDPEILSNSNGNQITEIADEVDQEIYPQDTCEEWISQVLNSIDYPETIFETFEHEGISKNDPEFLSNSNGNQITEIAAEVDQEIYPQDTCEEWISQVLNSIDYPETIFETFEHEGIDKNDPEFLSIWNGNQITAIADKMDQEIYPQDTCEEWISQVLNSIDYPETIFETFEHEGISKNDPEILSNSNGNQITEIADEVDQDIYPQDTCEEWISQVLNSIDYPETIFETFEHEGISKNDPEFLSNSNGNQITEIADEVDQEIYPQDTCEEGVTQVFNSIDHSETIFETFKHDGNGKNDPEILSIWNGNQITAIADKMDQEIFPQDTCEEWISQVHNSIDYPETIFETFEHEGISKNDPEILSNSNGNQITEIADEVDQEIYPQDKCEEGVTQVFNSIDHSETIFETFKHDGNGKNDPEILSIWNGNQITAIADKMDQEIFPQDTCEEWISQVLNSIDYPETIFETFEHEGISKNDPEILSNSNGNQITEIADEVDQEIYPQDTCVEWNSEVLNFIDLLEKKFETFEDEVRKNCVNKFDTSLNRP
ncbi:hypothetical protein TKK_0009172 [Trichogramma kaykai]